MRGVTHIQRGRLPPAHQHFGSATSRARTNDATRADTNEEEQQLKTPRTRLLTSEGCRYDGAMAVVRRRRVPAVAVGQLPTRPNAGWAESTMVNVSSMSSACRITCSDLGGR